MDEQRRVHGPALREVQKSPHMAFIGAISPSRGSIISLNVSDRRLASYPSGRATGASLPSVTTWLGWCDASCVASCDKGVTTIRLIEGVAPCPCRKSRQEIRLHVLCGARCDIQPCGVEATRAPEIFNGLGLGETGKSCGFKESGNLIRALDQRLELDGHGNR